MAGNALTANPCPTTPGTQFFSYTVSADKLTVRVLNNDVVNKDAASTKELEKAIAANRDNPEFFKKESIVFTKPAK